MLPAILLPVLSLFVPAATLLDKYTAWITDDEGFLPSPLGFSPAASLYTKVAATFSAPRDPERADFSAYGRAGTVARAWPWMPLPGFLPSIVIAQGTAEGGGLNGFATAGFVLSGVCAAERSH